MVEAILFDLDGTLYPYESINRLSLKKAWEVMREAIDISYSQFVELREEAKKLVSNQVSGGMRHDKYLQFQTMLEELGIFDSRLVLDMGDAYWKEFLGHLKRDREIVGMLKRLSKTHRIGIVTNLYLEIQLRKMKKLGIADYIDCVVTSEEIEMEKPSRLLFMLAAQKLMLLPNQCVFVGDSEMDMYGAFSIGMRTVGVGKKMEHAEFTISNVLELENILDKV